MSAPKHYPICPKCGYDQSGEIATWENRCPMSGTCPECGLGFDWAEVIDPGRVDLKWYAEHAKSNREMLKRTIPTIWMLLIPNRFWNRVSVRYEVQPRSLGVWLFGIVLVSHIFTSVLLLYAIYENTSSSNKSIRIYMSAYPAQASAYQGGIIDVASFEYWHHAAISCVFHLYWYVSMYRTEYTLMGSVISAALFGALIVWALILAVVPATRRRVQLRFAHVMRAFLLSLVCLVSIIEFGRFADAIIMLKALSINGSPKSTLSFVDWAQFFQISFFALVALVAIWIPWFWGVAIRKGWRIRSGWLLIFLGLVASTIGGVVVALKLYLLSY